MAGTGPLKINASDLMQNYEDAVAAAGTGRQPLAQPGHKAGAWGAAAASSAWSAPATAAATSTAGSAHAQWGGAQWGGAPAGRGAWGDVVAGGSQSPRVSRDMPRPGQAGAATEAEGRRMLALAEQVMACWAMFGVLGV